ncbi:MAG: DNA repair protein RecN, partial [Flavisolibacter sp.]
MLSRLSIQNYAIIEQLEVDFSSQLNIITGETGAGKSIIVGALGLILGQRAESGVLKNKEKKCIVEGCFRGEERDEQVLQFLRNHELDIHEELTVRREIAPGGKSRAFINDTPVNLSQLNALSSLLVDLHQQFDTLELGESDFQREVLDALGNTFPILKQYQQVFQQMQVSKKALEALKEQKAQFEKESDYHQFQFTELEEAGLRENELEDLEQELKLLTHAEGIKNALARAYYELEESETPIVRQLKTIGQQLQPFADLHPELPALAQRLQSACIELQDIADETDRLNNRVASDAARIDWINERISLGYKLLKKHGVKTTAELLSIHASLSEKIRAVLHIDDAIEEAEKKFSELAQKANELATRITTMRKAQVKPLEQQVNRMLVQVGMPAARLQVAIQ